MIDVNSNTVWQADWDSFGTLNLTINTVENNLRFPGQYYDSEIGFYYNFHRYYMPEVGRYLREDEVKNKWDFNLYVYVGGNPVMGIDNEGNFPWGKLPLIGDIYRCIKWAKKRAQVTKECQEELYKCKSKKSSFAGEWLTDCFRRFVKKYNCKCGWDKPNGEENVLSADLLIRCCIRRKMGAGSEYEAGLCAKIMNYFSTYLGWFK